MLRRLFNLNKFSFSSGYVSYRPDPLNTESIPFDFSDYKEVEDIIARYPPNFKRSAIMPLLTLAQKQNNNFLSLSAMKKVAKITEVNEMDVFEVASFYTMYNRQRVGKFHLQICGTTPCQLRGAELIISTCEEYAQTKCGYTSADGLWTLQEVQCLGACANAPMMQINGEWVYEDLTPENTVKLMDDLKAGKDKKGPQNNRNTCEGPQGRTTLIGMDLQQEVRHNRDFVKVNQDFQQEIMQKKLQAAIKAQKAKKLLAQSKKM